MASCKNLMKPLITPFLPAHELEAALVVEPTDFEDGEPIYWDKPLSKVFHLWPAYNLSNTVVVDHKSYKVGYNPNANVIISTPFYVQHMEKLEEDINYLKCSLWPLLEGFFASKDIQQFRSFYPQSFLEPQIRVPKVYELQGEYGISSFVEGEGTGEPYDSASHVSPHLLVQYVTNFLIWLCRELKGRERRRGRASKGGRGSVTAVPL
jgi:hypothetical protein